MKGWDCFSQHIFVATEPPPPPIINSDLQGPGIGCLGQEEKMLKFQLSHQLHFSQSCTAAPFSNLTK